MMDEQNLAARLDATPLYEGCGDASDLPERAAVELRRQHAEIERLRDLADSEGTRAVEYLRRARHAEAELERLRSGASAYDALLRANGPAWLQRVSGGSYSDAVADCKRAGWWPEPSNGWPDTDAERSAGA